MILDNIRSTYNVGAILRSAEGFGVTEVIFSGYTPFPGERPGVLPHVAEKLKNQIKKTALGAEEMVKCSYCPDIQQFLASVSGKNTQNSVKNAQANPQNTFPEAPIIALENNISDNRVMQLSNVRPALNGAKRAYLIAGEEVHGVDPALYPYISIFAEIPMRGRKESFNVSVATAIALYELTRNQA